MGRQSAGLTVVVAGLETLPAAARRPELVEAVVRECFKLEKSRAKGELSIVFVNRTEMLRLNRRFLQHDYDTDVISFAHERAEGVPPAECPFGDVYVSAWMAHEQAKQLGHSVLREALTLAAHGALHLLGHDDEKPKDKARMFKAQDAVLARVGAPE